MSLLNLILPTHAKLGRVLIGGAATSGAALPETRNPEPETRNLDRFEPWLLGLRNMIEEGDWHNAQVFAEQIRTRLRHLELEERCDAEGVVRR